MTWVMATAAGDHPVASANGRVKGVGTPGAVENSPTTVESPDINPKFNAGRVGSKGGAAMTTRAM